MSIYNDYLNNKHLKDKEENEKERKKILETLESEIRLILNDFKEIKKIVIFGSVNVENSYSINSDVDLYIEGE